MFFTFEFLCPSNFVSFVFCFYSSDCFFLEFFKVVHSFLIFFFSVVAAIDIHVSPRASTVDRSYCKALGRNNSEVGQEPITRREQLPVARAMAFSRTSSFLERFLARILNIF